MHPGQLAFAQVMAYLPLKAFSRMVAARRAQHKVQVSVFTSLASGRVPRPRQRGLFG